MAKRQPTHAHLNSAGAKFAFAALIALSFLFAQSVMTTARADKKPNYGRIKISTTPGGYPILIDGKPAGETTTSDRLLDLPPGLHTVEILFPNGETWTREFNVNAGRIYCIGLAYAPKSISIPPPLPCPYPVNVSAPSAVNDGDVITFAADVAYGGSSALNYTWTVSPASARILNGAGTPSITVDTTGLGKQKVQAILVVDDGSGERLCRQTAQAATNVIPLPPPPKNKCYDCFPFTAFDDTKARLDNLAIELQNNPTAQGYIIAYAGRGSRAGQADRLIKRAKDYLIQSRGMDPSRLTVINGGYRDTDYFELWVVPQGAEPPQPTPTMGSAETQPGAMPPATPTRTRRSRRSY
ncbi:MAG TPA: PEGA domain-containing protein [Pyrinomonadaceae bacterium]